MTRHRERRWATLGVAALFTGSGILHLVRPAVFMPLVPRGLPSPDLLVMVSGLAELVCATGLLARRSWAGPASAVLLVAILPGNIQFAVDRAADPSVDPRILAGAWLRLPLQAVLVWAVLQGGRRADERSRMEETH